MSPEEKLVRDKLIKAGIQPAPDQTGAPIAITVTARVTENVNQGLARLAVKLKLEMIALIKNIEWSSQLNRLRLFPTMLDSNIAQMTESMKCNRSGSEISISFNMDSEEWLKLENRERITKLSEEIKKAVSGINKKFLQEKDRLTLLAVVDSATKKVTESECQA